MTLLGTNTREPRVFVTPRGATTLNEIDLNSRLVSFTYSEEIGKPDKGIYIFDNRDGELSNPARIALGIELETSFGYPGSTAPVRTVVIRKLRGTLSRAQSGVPVASGGKATITYEGTGGLAQMNVVFEDARRSFENMKISDIVRIVANRNGFTGASAIIQDTEVTRTIVVMKEGETEAAFLHRLAKFESHFHFTIGRLGLIFATEEFEPATEIITFFDGPDVIDVEFEGDFMLPRPGKVTAKGIDSRTRTLIIRSAPVDPLGAVSLPLGLIDPDAPGSPARSRLAARETIVTARPKEKALKKAIDRFEKIAQRLWKLRIRVVGNPAIELRRTVLLENFGPLVDGAWFVRKVKHQVSPTKGYITEFLCRRKKPAGGGGAFITLTIRRPDGSVGLVKVPKSVIGR